MDIVVLILTGAVAGTLAGLFGIGGGAIIVPVLALVFERQGVASGVLMQSAIGTSLATIVFTAISSIRAHHARGAVDWAVFRRLMPGILIGAIAGAAVAHLLSSMTLKFLFGIFLLGLALQMVRELKPESTRQLPGRLGMTLTGGAVGGLSSLFGIGGAAINVPLLTWWSVPPVRAVATSAAVGLPIALAGTAGYVITGLYAADLPPLSLGYVVLPAFGGIVVASMVFAPLGARLAHKLAPLVLRRLFAALLLVFGLRLLLG